MRKLRVARVLKGTLAVIAGLLASYAMAAILLGRMQVNSDFKPVANGIEIFLVTNGLHAALVIPGRADDIDLTELLALPRQTEGTSRDHLLIGWGDRRIYPGTTTIGDLTLFNALTALLGLNGAVMHVEPVAKPPISATSRATRIGSADYKRLVGYIAQSMRHDANGAPIPVADPAVPSSAHFYLARGRYQPFVTCNEWVRRALAEAGIRTARWSPLDRPLFDQFPG